MSLQNCFTICITVVLFWKINTGCKLCTLFCVSCTKLIGFLHLFMLWFEWKQRIRGWHRTPYAVSKNGATLKRRRRGGGKSLNKVVFLFFVYKNYSHHFITFRLNHWWQMDYFDKAFYTFLCLDNIIYLAVNGTVTSPPVFIQNI